MSQVMKDNIATYPGKHSIRHHSKSKFSRLAPLPKSVSEITAKGCLRGWHINTVFGVGVVDADNRIQSVCNEEEQSEFSTGILHVAFPDYSIGHLAMSSSYNNAYAKESCCMAIVFSHNIHLVSSPLLYVDDGSSVLEYLSDSGFNSVNEGDLADRNTIASNSWILSITVRRCVQVYFVI